MKNDNDSHLNRWQKNKAKDGAYETSKEVAKFIYNCISETFDEELKYSVFDPTAGSGRLLAPFKKAGHKTIGIEYNYELYNKLKYNIGKKNAKYGELISIFSRYRQDFSSNFSVDVFISNPPYGLYWDVGNIPIYARPYMSPDEQCESKGFCIFLSTLLLKEKCPAVFILPKSFWTADRDNEARTLLYSKFNIHSKVTLTDGFKDEYGLNIETDIIFAEKKSYRSYNKVESNNNYIVSIKDLNTINVKTIYHDKLYAATDGWYKMVNTIDGDNMFKIPNINADHSIEFKNKKITGNEEIIGLINFYDKAQLNSFSEIYGTETTISKKYFSLPSIILNGITPTINFCKNVGIDFKISDRSIKEIKKMEHSYRKAIIPLEKPVGMQLLAYYENKKYQALCDYPKDDVSKIIIKGKYYHIKPVWARNQNLVSETKEKNATITKQYIESGCMHFHVTVGKNKIIFKENDKENINDFIEIFKPDNISYVAKDLKNTINGWEHIVNKKYPFLYDFQKKDLIVALTKNNVYLGHEQGGGKTIMGLCYADARQYKRVLIICKSSAVNNWIAEAKKFNFKITPIRSHKDIDTLQARIKNKDFENGKTEFFVIGQEFLSLDGGKTYDTWECIKLDKKNNIIHQEKCNKAKCSKGHKYEITHKVCPKCETVIGEGWSGSYCNNCGYRPYTYGRSKYGVGFRQYPAYRRIKKLFTCIMTDESQHFAKRSLRGEASRALKSKSKLLLSGTIMRNYIEDVFLNFGWLLGYNNPNFYFERGDIKTFLNEFGSYEIITKEYLQEMKDAKKVNRKNGRKKLLPAVSNLSRFWKIISPFTVRKLSTDIKELKEIDRERYYIYAKMDIEHSELYTEYENWAKSLIEKELRKPETEINLGIISLCLWRLRFAASCPNSPKLLEYNGNGDYPYLSLESNEFNKIKETYKIVKKAKENNEKVIIFSGLRYLQLFTYRYLSQKGYNVKFIPSSVKTNDRYGAIKDFEKNYDVMVTGSEVANECYSIVGANHVIIMNQEYNPSTTDQAEFRVIRPGQKKKVYIYYLISSGTIDEDIKKLCDEKRKAIRSAIDKKTCYTTDDDLIMQASTRNAEVTIAKELLKKPIAEKIPTKKIVNAEYFETFDFWK